MGDLSIEKKAASLRGQLAYLPYAFGSDSELESIICVTGFLRRSLDAEDCEDLAFTGLSGERDARPLPLPIDASWREDSWPWLPSHPSSLASSELGLVVPGAKLLEHLPSRTSLSEQRQSGSHSVVSGPRRARLEDRKDRCALDVEEGGRIVAAEVEADSKPSFPSASRLSDSPSVSEGVKAASKSGSYGPALRGIESDLLLDER